MDPIIGGSLISAGASLLGGLFGGKRAESAAEQQYKHQKEFAQHGIQWRAADAKAAGLHPLAALGASGASYSPVSVGDSAGAGLAGAGQDIGRAVASTASRGERALTELEAASLRNERLRGDLLQEQVMASRAARMQADQVGPPLPSPMGEFSFKPPDIPTSRPGMSHITAGPAVPSYQEADFGPFKLNLLSPNVSEQLEDMEAAKYALMYMGNKERIDNWMGDAIQHYGEPFFKPIYEAQRFIEDAPANLRRAIEDAQNDLTAWAARKRLPKHRSKPYWKN